VSGFALAANLWRCKVLVMTHERRGDPSLGFLQLVLAALLLTLAPSAALAQDVPLRSLGRFDDWRENALVGYGLVTGLAGSGDTRPSAVTRQALRNVLSRLGTAVTEDQISSRNVAVVIVTARLTSLARAGDRIDTTVSSIGDARSLAGGTLLLTPLLGPDQRPYALAQGALVVSGQSEGNHPTSAVLQGGATVEAAADPRIGGAQRELGFLLSNPNFATAQRIADAVNTRFGAGVAVVKNADEVSIRIPAASEGIAAFVAQLEALAVQPARGPLVIINERTGTIVAGGDVGISSVVISQGDIKVTILADGAAAQRSFISGFGPSERGVIVTNTMLAEAGSADASIRLANTSVADLVQALVQARVQPRRTISILQAIRAAGALQAEIAVR
jgi:flagellar P-ring protein precursor FlgI